MDGNRFAPNTLLILRDIAEDVEGSHGHVVLESHPDDTYVIGHPTEICAHLPLGVFVYDAEFNTVSPYLDPGLFVDVDDDTPDGEVEELDSDSADEEVYEIIAVVENFDDEVMRRYGIYEEIVEYAAGFESTPDELAQVRESYPEVIEMLEVMVYDALGLLDAVALMNAASYAIQEGIADERKRELAMGIFIDLYAEEFGPQMFDLLDDEEDAVDGRYAILTFETNVWHNRDMVVARLEELIAALKSEEHEDAEGLGFVYVSSVPEVDTEEPAVETVNNLPDSSE